MIKFIFLHFINIALLYGNELTSKQSFSALFNVDTRIHATPHITNLIRNGPGQLTINEQEKLEKLGLFVNKNKLLVERPEGLDETYSTEHFLLHYTLNDSYNAVDDENYVAKDVKRDVENIDNLFYIK